MELNNVKETGVLIVGAGPCGLALACDLARRGVPALLAEQAPALFPGSRGKGIQPRTREVFDDLGIGDAVREHGGPAPVGMVWQNGERMGEHRMFRVAAPTDAEPYGEPWLMPQWRTQEILLARLRELGGDVAFSTALTGLAQDADGVTAQLSTGPVRASYLVAADGGRSTVRRALGIAMAGETVDPAPMLVADVRVAEGALDRLNWHMMDTDAGFITLCPLPGTADFQLAARFKEGEPDTSAEGVRALVAERTHLAAQDITEVLWASDFRPRAALADRFREGRVFLAGDAAHVHSPAGGQGLNTSVQDAYNLGWKLGRVLRHGAPEALLGSYEAERRPVAAEVLGLSTRIHRGRQERGAAAQQLGIGYREGPLSVGSAGALRAGDRAPDGPAGDRRLFDVFRGPHFTLLAVGTDAELPRFAGSDVRVHRMDAYEAYGKGLFLVRPDGYLGWAGEEPGGLAEYLAPLGVALAAG
ncbi:2-polyprenyl-6-methoxyphenol hydroxylase-like FAD-dependent oxidoreductase [Streptomyces sp. 840.1]|uniref:FAD-dependent monooxygenase n=1 Tax=Streptomyces sp. 840.1 TaxID=2485152 RepID=UPI000F481292|nr:FAD-dependent monooxygenase [Streptomyces sp. 840.1]ROQ66561.1 2-polyprenyl-6-methoxyphenol hydroxylase-like FAD-dependent oxidoreductase [Streptomyces sp. 840.1]